MYFLDRITVGDESSPVYESYEYSPKTTILGLPAWAALLILIALPIITFLTLYITYGKNNQ